MLLFVREVTGSFAIAGLASGALAVGMTLGAPVAGRLVDSRGSGLLLPLAVLHVGALMCIWSLGEAGGPAPFLILCPLITGAAFPPSGAVLRTRWPEFVEDREQLRTAPAGRHTPTSA